jgi:hypothetical protein
MIFGSPGNVTIIVVVKDKLGSISTDDTEGTVVGLTTAPTNSVLLDIMTSMASTGDPFATLAAVNAIAGVSADGALSETFLDIVSNSSTLSDWSIGKIDATSAAVDKVHNSTGSARHIRGAVTAKAANLIFDIATASTSLSGGIQVEVASNILDSVDMLFTIDMAPGGTPSKSAAALSARLQDATSSIGDALAKDAFVGEAISVVAAGGRP